MTRRAERLLAAGVYLAEGPVWDPDTGDVVWVDILEGRIHRTRLSSPDRRTETLDEAVGAVVRTAGGGWCAFTGTGLRRVDAAAGHPHVARLPHVDPELRANDGKADPAGRFLGGTMCRDQPRRPVGSLWRLGPDEVREEVGGVTISNGLAWSEDGTALFWIDTPTGRIDRFDRDPATGDLSGRRPEVEVDGGGPDGMCIDAEGGLWVAVWGAGQVRRYADGGLSEIVEVPTPHVSCPVFVGEGLDTMVITTAQEGLDPVPDGAGDLYVVDPGVRGAPAHVLGSWAG